MICLQDIVFRFQGGDFVLKIQNLEIPPKSLTAIVGPSGSGKTTVLNMIAGILVPDSGIVRVDECELSDQSDAMRRAFRLRRIGFVFQNFDLIDYLTVEDNILISTRIDSKIRLTDALRLRARQLAMRVGLDHKLSSSPAMLSHGERQRVAIARALLLQPGLILADEATGNLDPANKTLIMDLLLSEAHAIGATVVAVTHDHDLLSRFDRIIDFKEMLEAPC